MKKATNNVGSVLRRFITPAALVCALMVSTIPTQLYANDKKEITLSSPVQVQYLGEINKQPVVQIDINNNKEEDLVVVLKDENGYNLYAERIKGDKFSKKFQFSDATSENVNVTVSLISRKDKKEQQFQIKNVVTMVENVVVTKVN